MAASENKKKKCETIIPTDWPQHTGPAYKSGMTTAQARKLWFDFLREQQKIGPTPRIYRHKQ